MTDEQDDTPELDALSTLVSSDGWRMFCEHVERNHGSAACIQQIDLALAAVGRGDRDAADETVTQIRARSKAATALVTWPKERIAQLKPAKKSFGFAMQRRA